jgi:RimJ/RimL family protein N-acetyltransferase
VNWLLGRAWWGKGLAFEGATACIAYAFNRLDSPTISAFIESSNERSLRLAHRLGMADIDEPWPGVRQFQRRRED